MKKRSAVPPDWLYTLIVASLGIYFVIGAIIWSVLALNGRPMPDSFATILATIAGGLVGVLTPSDRSSTSRGSDSEGGASQ